MFILSNTEFLKAQEDTVKTTVQAGNSTQIIPSDSLPKKYNGYKVQLKQNSGKYGKGYLTNVTDVELHYSNKNNAFGETGNDVKKVMYEDLDYIAINRTGAALTGAFIGLGIGLTMGIVGSSGGEGTGNFSNVGPGSGAIVLAGALLGTLSGAVLGAITDELFKKRFNITGNHEKYKQMKQDVLQKVYGKQAAGATAY